MSGHRPRLTRHRRIPRSVLEAKLRGVILRQLVHGRGGGCPVGAALRVEPLLARRIKNAAFTTRTALELPAVYWYIYITVIDG